MELEKNDKYIFPNNIENPKEKKIFLKKIINKENSDIFDCWNSFEKCLLDKNKGYGSCKKSKVYLYHEALIENKDNCKDSGRDFKDK